MMIALDDQTHVFLIFVTVDLRRDVVEAPIPVQTENANVVSITSVHLHTFVLLEIA